jgi:hypothetical protein
VHHWELNPEKGNREFGSALPSQMLNSLIDALKRIFRNAGS